LKSYLVDVQDHLVPKIPPFVVLRLAVVEQYLLVLLETNRLEDVEMMLRWERRPNTHKNKTLNKLIQTKKIHADKTDPH
jgi:hypothetical protein